MLIGWKVCNKDEHQGSRVSQILKCHLLFPNPLGSSSARTMLHGSDVASVWRAVRLKRTRSGIV
jgi:hypothetical protein